MRLFCARCNLTVDTGPPRFVCPHCQADLHAQASGETEPVFLPENEMQHFYDRAVEFTLAKNDEGALEMIERGLARFDAPELHLLAALIHRKRQEYEAMRRHIAAIPANDSLRGEAEWLLHSHQEQQKKLRRQVRQTGRQLPRLPEEKSPEAATEPAQRRETGAARHTRKRAPQWLWAIPTVALLAAVVWWQAPQLQGWFGALAPTGNTMRLPEEDANQAAAAANNAGLSNVETSLETGDETANNAEPESAATMVEVEAPTALPTAAPPTSTPTVVPTQEPTAMPTATPPPNIVEAPSPIPQPLAASGTAETLVVVATTEQVVVDITPYLELFGRPDLGELELSARRQDETLILEGIVTSTQQRNDLLALAARMPGVEEVNGIDLLIRLPETYVVKADDTLWSIAFDLYGAGARWSEILDANREQLGNGSRLTPGQELIVPPLQGNP